MKPTDLTKSINEVLMGEATIMDVALPVGSLTLIPSIIDLVSASCS